MKVESNDPETSLKLTYSVIAIMAKENRARWVRGLRSRDPFTESAPKDKQALTGLVRGLALL